MIKKKCLKCDKDFDAEKDTAKYCSTSCRVMYNRNKTDKVEKMKSAAIHNEIMEVLDEMKELSKQVASDLFMFGQARMDGKPLIEGFTHDTKFSVIPIETPKPKIRRSFEYFQQAKIECQDIEQWAELKEEIQNSDLSPRQKALLIS